MRNFKDLSHFETFYVVKIHNAFQVRLRVRVRARVGVGVGVSARVKGFRASPSPNPVPVSFQMADSKPCFYFSHPNPERNPDNARYTPLEFDVPVGV